MTILDNVVDIFRLVLSKFPILYKEFLELDLRRVRLKLIKLYNKLTNLHCFILQSFIDVIQHTVKPFLLF